MASLKLGMYALVEGAERASVARGAGAAAGRCCITAEETSRLRRPGVRKGRETKSMCPSKSDSESGKHEVAREVEFDCYCVFRAYLTDCAAQTILLPKQEYTILLPKLLPKQERLRVRKT